MKDVSSLDILNLLNHAYIGVVIHAVDTSIVYANPTALKLLRLTQAQVIGKDAMDPQWHFVDEQGRKLPVEDYPVNQAKSRNSPIVNEVLGVIDSSRKEVSWFLVNAYQENAQSDEDGFIIVTFNDITEKKTQFSFEHIVENAQDIIIVTEASPIDAPLGPKIIYVNKAFERISGYRADEVIGETPRILQGKFTDKETTERIHNALEQKQPLTETILNYAKNGRPYWLEMNIIPLKNSFDEVTHFAAIERDVTEKRFHAEQLESRNKDLKLLKENLEKMVQEKTDKLLEANYRLERMAYYDSLTELPNRRAFELQSDKIFGLAVRKKLALAYGIIDVDDFKAVNDNHGHDMGDLVLKSMGQVFRESFRAEEVIGRLGGEEFAFIAMLDEPNDSAHFCERLLKKIAQIRLETPNSETISITASIGVCVFKPEVKPNIEQLYRCADAALYRAKSAGKNCFETSSL
ncbi:diguanylate cyclase [Aliiglaciecola sp. CAU 1673]|uniref:diguanylate cyclase n=1 Tax=Aliiglaciecola sp. CAU 1673 TaxID=3032595 RepID=UPI0023DBAEBF|nr:diguanylate cyclase [Aliiglaciecola sp. CAU 1673]MDF2177665.1 diguanylate cyclase [Aliiglaciecola sp. CAU 1673]